MVRVWKERTNKGNSNAHLKIANFCWAFRTVAIKRRSKIIGKLVRGGEFQKLQKPRGLRRELPFLIYQINYQTYLLPCTLSKLHKFHF